MKPTIIVIVADDPGYSDLGCFGNPIVRAHKRQRELEDWFDRVTTERASRPET